MANDFTPDDERALELDEQFMAHVVEAEPEDDYDLAVASDEEEAAHAAEKVDGVEFVGMAPLIPLALFEYAD